VSRNGGQEHLDTVTSAPRVRVLVVAGMSGAGRSTVQNIPGDIGVDRLDTLPASIFSALTERSVGDGRAPAAVLPILDTLSGRVSLRR
jgi:hypothetical protein